MAKKAPKDKNLTRRQVARRDKEYRAQRLITWIAAGLGVVILGILIYGIVTEVFIKAQRPVAKIGDTVITTQAYQARQEYERWMTQLQIYQYESYLTQLAAQQSAAPTPTTPEDGAEAEPDVDLGMDSLIQQLQLQLSNLQRQLSPDLASVFGGQVLDRMIEEELVRQEAATRGLSVSEEEMQEAIGILLGYNPEATSPLTDTSTLTQTVAPTVEQESYADLYRQFKTNVLQTSRYSEKAFREMVRANLLQEKLRAELAQGAELEQEQVEAVLFALESEEAAEAVRTRLTEDGEDPDALVEEFGTDEDETTIGYSLPWLPIGYLGPQLGLDVERAAFNTTIGKTSPPILGDDGMFYVVYVKDREVRELSADLAAQAEEQTYAGWLAQAKDERAEYFDWQSALVTD